MWDWCPLSHFVPYLRCFNTTCEFLAVYVVRRDPSFLALVGDTQAARCWPDCSVFAGSPSGEVMIEDSTDSHSYFSFSLFGKAAREIFLKLAHVGAVFNFCKFVFLCE